MLSLDLDLSHLLLQFEGEGPSTQFNLCSSESGTLEVGKADFADFKLFPLQAKQGFELCSPTSVARLHLLAVFCDGKALCSASAATDKPVWVLS